MDAVHADGSLELDTHNLYGAMQAQATAKYFTDTLKKRPMIVSRSSFAGQGKYSARTLGDNESNYNYMAYSVTGVMLSNIMGQPMAGADICGYRGDASMELCARWYTVGAFYPFSRNHNSLEATAQEPYMWADTIIPHYIVKYTGLDIIKWAMDTKMSLIRYYYT